MGFLVPAFFAGLAGLAIPIWIHLRHREQKGAIRFPSLMFLRRIPYREVRRQQLHHLPLFLIRAAVLILLALAFARPFLRRPVAAATLSGGSQEVVILLDRSYSMEYGGRWDRAVALAREALAGLDPADRATLILFDTEAAVPVRPGSPPRSVLPVLDTIRPGAKGTRFAPALKVAQDHLATSEMPRRTLTLISDFQRAAWPEIEEIALPSGTVFQPLSVGEASSPDRLIASVELRREGDGSDVIVGARLLARDSAVGSVRVSLTVNNRVLNTQSVTLQSGTPLLVTFPAVTVTGTVTRGMVRIESTDSLERNNVSYFSLRRENPLGIVLGGTPSTSAGDPDLFLNRALTIPGRPAVRLVESNANRLGRAELSGPDVVILHNAPLRGVAARTLEERVRAGAGLILIAGVNTPRDAWPASLRPAQLGDVIDRSTDRGGRMVSIDRTHPVFELFRGPETGDFSSARFFRYRNLLPDAEGRVLARFDDGRPALVERSVGKGTVLALASSLGNVWSDLPVQPAFLPYVHELVVYASGYHALPAAWGVGEVTRLAVGDSGQSVVVTAPAGRRLRRETGQDMIRFEEPGFYHVLEPGVGGRELAAYAANVDVEESNLTPLDPAELAIAVGGANSGAVPVATLATATEQEGKQRLWWYLIVAVAVLVVVETFVGNRLSGIVRDVPAG